MKLNEINALHPSLKFTVEVEENNCLPFLDMKILNDDGELSSVNSYLGIIYPLLTHIAKHMESLIHELSHQVCRVNCLLLVWQR